MNGFRLLRRLISAGSNCPECGIVKTVINVPMTMFRAWIERGGSDETKEFKFHKGPSKQTGCSSPED